MSKRKSHLYSLYANPLPLTLPKITLSNVIFGFDIHQDEIKIVYKDSIFCTIDNESTERLWFNGFFGKGSLSRSEPTFAQRTMRRLDLEKDEKGNDKSKLSSEEITKFRRLEREEFKRRRLELENLEKSYKLSNQVERLQEVERMKFELNKQFKIRKPIEELLLKYSSVNNTTSEHGVIAGSETVQPSYRPEDLALIDDPESIRSLEYLQLSPFEALFLSLINRIKIYEDDDNFICFKDLVHMVFPDLYREDNGQLLKFISYYHYRTLGWCVRSGVKFSTDFILYEKGPVFQHAHFAVLLMNSSESNNVDWIHMNAVNRVVGGVKKQLVLNFIEINRTDFKSHLELFINCDKDNELDLRLKFVDLMKLYNVREIGLNRWSNTRNRE